MGREVVDPESAREVGVVTTREQLDHVTEVSQPVVDRRRGEQEDGLWPDLRVEQIEELAVARLLVSSPVAQLGPGSGSGEPRR